MNPDDEVELLEVPGRQYLMIDGSGDPNTSQAFTDAVEALFATAYALKFACKRSGVEFAVSPLEGLWSADGPAPRASPGTCERRGSRSIASSNRPTFGGTETSRVTRGPPLVSSSARPDNIRGPCRRWPLVGRTPFPGPITSTRPHNATPTRLGVQCSVSREAPQGTGVESSS